MRMSLRCEDGADGPEVWACVDGASFARARMTVEGYHVDRDAVLPELEPAVRELEERCGYPVRLAPGEDRGVEVGRPGDHTIAEARSGPPPYRPAPALCIVHVP